MRKTNTIESVSSAPMSGFDGSWTSVGRMRFKPNGLGLRGLGIDIVQGNHKTELVADLAGVDSWFLPAILATSSR